MTLVISTPIFTQEVPEKGAAKGHVRFQVLSMNPEDFALAGFCATIASTVLYEKLQAGGTSFIIDFTREQARIDVLARYEEDGVELQWPLKPADAAQLEAIQERIRAKTFFIGAEKKNDSVAVAKETKTNDVAGTAIVAPATKATIPSIHSVDPMTTTTSDQSEEEEEYLTKQLHRIP